MAKTYLLSGSAVAALLVSALSAGAVVYRPADAPAVERTSIQLLLGLGLLGTLLFVVGSFTFTVPSIVTILGASALCFVFRVRSSYRMCELTDAVRRTDIGVGTAIAISVVLMLLVSGFAAPVGDVSHDGIRYHLLGPRVWLRDGFIHPLSHESHTAFPVLIETLFAAVIALSNDRAPGLLGACFAGILMCQCYLLVRRLTTIRLAAEIAIVLVAMMPVAMNHAEEAFIDIPFACFALAGAILAHQSVSTSQTITAGMLLGFAAGTKYPGLFVIGVTAVLIAVLTDVRAERGSAFRRSICLLICAFTVAAPPYIRNYVVLGTPIYPPPTALARFFPPLTMSPAEIEKFELAIFERGKGLGTTPVDFLLLPFRFTYYTAWFHGAGGIGIALLAFAPLGILASRDVRLSVFLALWSLMIAGLWFVTQQEARFLIHLLTIAAAFSGIGACSMLSYQMPGGKWLVYTTLTASVLYGAIGVIHERVPRLLAAISPEHAAKRERASVPYLEAFRYLNTNSDVANTLVLRTATPPYYLTRPYLLQEPNPADPLPQVLAAGTSHILDTMHSGRWVIAEPGPLALVFSSEEARVYRAPDNMAQYSRAH